MILNLWSSYGYCGEEEHIRMFTVLRNRTARNGLLIDDTVNRDYLVTNPQAKTVDIVGDWNYVNVESSILRLRGMRATGLSTRLGDTALS